MSRADDCAVLRAPREGVNDDTVRVLRWLAAEGEKVRAGQPVVTLETTKSTFDADSPADAYLFPQVAEGSEAPVGGPLALVAPTPQRPHAEADPTAEEPA